MKLKQSLQDYFLGKKTLLRAFIVWCMGYIVLIYSLSMLYKLINYLSSDSANIFLNQYQAELYVVQELSLVLYAFIIVPLSVIVISQCWKNTKKLILGKIISILYYIYSFIVIFTLSDSIKHLRVNSPLFFDDKMPLHHDTRLYWYLFSISILVHIWVTHNKSKEGDNN